MTDLGGLGAAAVTSIGTIAVVGMAAKVANNAVKNVGRMPKTKSGYGTLSGGMKTKRSHRRTVKKSFSIFD